MTSSMNKKEYLHWYQRMNDNQRSFVAAVKPSSSSINLNSGSSHFFNQHFQDPFPTSGSEHSSMWTFCPRHPAPSLIPCISIRVPPWAHAETGNIVVGGTKHSLQSIPDGPRPAAGGCVQQTSLFAVSGERGIPFRLPLLRSWHRRTVFPTPDPRQLWGSADTVTPGPLLV